MDEAMIPSMLSLLSGVTFPSKVKCWHGVDFRFIIIPENGWLLPVLATAIPMNSANQCNIERP